MRCCHPSWLSKVGRHLCFSIISPVSDLNDRFCFPRDLCRFGDAVPHDPQHVAAGCGKRHFIPSAQRDLFIYEKVLQALFSAARKRQKVAFPAGAETKRFCYCIIIQPFRVLFFRIIRHCEVACWHALQERKPSNPARKESESSFSYWDTP